MKKIIALFTAVCVISVLCACEGGTFSNMGDKLTAFFEIEKPENQIEESNDKLEETREISNDISVGIVNLDTYNPLTTNSPTVRDVCGFIFEPLFSVDSSMRTIPVLAESYDVSNDGMSLSIHLKQGVKWHDGTEFTAYDAAYTISYIQSGVTRYTSLTQPVSGVWAVDNYTVSIAFSRPVPDAASLFIFPMIKNKSATAADYKPVGTGPFYMAGKESDNLYRLSVFEDYHKGRAVLDNVYVSVIPDNEKYVSLFNANELDLATSELLDMSTFMPKSNANVQDFISNNMIFVGFNTRSAQLTDAKTRRAVSMMIDRDSIVTHIYYSRAKAADYAINPQSWLNFDTRSRLTSDRTGAEQILREAGWRLSDANGVYFRDMSGKTVYFNVDMIVNSDNQKKVETAEYIAEKLHTAGINVKVEKCGFDEYNSRISAGNYDMFIGETELLPNNDLTPLVGSAGNYFFYANSEVDTLLQQMGTVKYESDIKAVSLKLYETIREESPFAPLCFIKKSLVSGSKIKYGVNPSIGGYVRESENWGVK